MKTFVRTITVFVVLNLAMGSFAPAEYATEEEPASPSAQAVPAARTTGEADVAKGAYNYIYAPYTSSVTKKQTGGAGAVLVIPSAEMKAEELAAIMEDLSVMSRIFDKKLGWLIPAIEERGFREDYFHYVLSRNDKRVTEAIYLGGFGAMFLTSVDFPLSPPPEVEEKKKAKEDVDSVWSDTKREIYSPEEATGFRELTSGGGTRQKEKGRVQKYDAERVEELKRTLTKALKHAANIRGLKGDELVTVVVRGSGPAMVVRIINGKQWWEAAKPGTAGLSLPTFLTIRAKKSDIDGFAKNELDDAEFRKRTQIITY